MCALPVALIIARSEKDWPTEPFFEAACGRDVCCPVCCGPSASADSDFEPAGDKATNQGEGHLRHGEHARNAGALESEVNVGPV
jgi:hypothetical protein